MTVESSGQEHEPPLDSEDEIRRKAKQKILEQALRALQNEEEKRFDSLIEKLLPDDRRSWRFKEHNAELAKERKMTNWRIGAAFTLIIGLLVIVAFALSQKNSNGQATAQYVSLLSGLAGIAIGWLYGSSGQRRRDGGS